MDPSAPASPASAIPTEVVGAHLQHLLAANLLHLILLPTEKCNFRCTYCYEDFERGQMRAEVVRGVQRLLERRASELDRLEIDWFGGEPMLAFGVIREVQGKVLELRLRYPDLETHGSMTTNGYLLTPTKLEELVSLDVKRFQVSVDGLSFHHDARRPRIDGQGTFATVWENLRAASALDGLDFRIDLRTHLDPANEKDFEEFLELYKVNFESDSRFRLFVREVSRLGGPNDSSLEVFEKNEARELVSKRRNQASDLGLEVKERGFEAGYCYAAAANSFVIRSDGELAKCTVAFRSPTNSVGRIHENGTLEINGKKMSPWTRGILSGEQKALKCPLQELPPSVPSSKLPIVT